MGFLPNNDDGINKAAPQALHISYIFVRFYELIIEQNLSEFKCMAWRLALAVHAKPFYNSPARSGLTPRRPRAPLAKTLREDS
jgi:hypothetical protein